MPRNQRSQTACPLVALEMPGEACLLVCLPGPNGQPVGVPQRNRAVTVPAPWTPSWTMGPLVHGPKTLSLWAPELRPDPPAPAGLREPTGCPCPPRAQVAERGLVTAISGQGLWQPQQLPPLQRMRVHPRLASWRRQPCHAPQTLHLQVGREQGEAQDTALVVPHLHLISPNIALIVPNTA